MAFGHEKLDLYRAVIEYVGWAYRYCETLKEHRNAKDQLLRASQGIALKITEGNGPRLTAKRRTGIDAGSLKSHEVRRYSAAIQDVLHLWEALSACQQATTISRRHCSIVFWPC